MHERRLRARASSVSAAGHASSSASAAAADAPLSMPVGHGGQDRGLHRPAHPDHRHRARGSADSRPALLQDGQPVPHRPPAAVGRRPARSTRRAAAGGEDRRPVCAVPSSSAANSSSDWEMPGATMSDWSIDMPQVIAAGAMPPLTAVAVWLRRCRKCSQVLVAGQLGAGDDRGGLSQGQRLAAELGGQVDRALPLVHVHGEAADAGSSAPPGG